MVYIGFNLFILLAYITNHTFKIKNNLFSVLIYFVLFSCVLLTSPFVNTKIHIIALNDDFVSIILTNVLYALMYFMNILWRTNSIRVNFLDKSNNTQQHIPIIVVLLSFGDVVDDVVLYLFII